MRSIGPLRCAKIRKFTHELCLLANHLESVLAMPSKIVDSNRLTDTVRLLESTLMKNLGWGGG